MTPFFFAMLRVSTERWLSWLSNIRMEGFSIVEPLYCTKCFITRENNSPFIQPDGDARPSVPGGAPFIIWGLNFFLGNIMTGGRVFPEALIMRQDVIRTPLSPLVHWETCLVPFADKTFFGLWTVVVAVSSRLYIRVPSANLGERP